VGSETEMLDGFTGVLWSSEEKGVGASWGALRKLIEGEGLAASLDDAGTGGGGETEGSDGQLWDFEEALRCVSKRCRFEKHESQTGCRL
jgi:hypothetical protein